MPEGIRAEVRITDPSGCPISSLTQATNTDTSSVSRSVDPHEPTRMTEEFELVGKADTSSVDAAGVGLEEVFTYGSRHAYRFDRHIDWGCPCEQIEQFGCPVIDIHARSGSLDVTFHATGIEQFREIVTALRERDSGVEVRRLLRTRGVHDDQDLVFFDTNTLTDRQREVLEIAHAMGYFDHPKGANAGDVATRLKISTTTFTEHLSAAQRKILDALLEK